MNAVNKQICGKTKEEWQQEYPIIKDICTYKEAVWCNPFKEPFEKAILSCPLTKVDIEAAEARLKRFARYFRVAFPETSALNGILESPVQEIQNMKSVLENQEHVSIAGNLWIKLDSHLPISGSIKARGGIYEVLKIAEDIALEHNLINEDSDYALFNTEDFHKVFSQYAIAVGSTGNLGLSIGIMSAKLGFRVTVHMSADARQWKKDLLRQAGVEVLEYKSDYGIAVAEGRKAAQSDPFCRFIDDENSQTLFLGYAVAGLRLKKQLEEKKIEVDNKHPLFVYLPCGVGGGPGGVAFGLKMIFGDAVHCFFAEPTHSCCMMLGMATGKNNAISVQDFGLDNCTAADGLAVGRASGFVGSLMLPFISGCYSLDDSRMFHMLTALADAENIYLEPSALAGMYGPVLLEKSFDFRNYIKKEYLDSSMMHSTQLIWATGGSMVPKNEMLSYYKQGQIS